MTEIRVAVIGVGALGTHHARVYSQLPGARLTAVVDIVQEKARAAGEKYGCLAACDYREIIEKVDAVSLAVPTELHAAIGEELLDQGINVLVEKPISRTVDEASRLVHAQARSGRVLRVGHVERFNPAVRAALPFRTSPRFFESHRLGVFSPRSLDIDVVLDLMVHDLDLVLQLTRSSVADIKAVGIPILTPRIDIANARLEFEDGCVANLTASRVSKDKVRKLRFFQPSDYISIDFFKQEVEMYSLVRNPSGPQIVERMLEIAKEEPLKLELISFLRAVRGEPTVDDEFAACTGEQGTEVLTLAMKILEAMRRR